MKSINQLAIKEINKKRLYHLITENPNISRTGLAGMARLSKATVSTLVEELIAEAYIVDRGTQTNDRNGRNPNVLTVNYEDNGLIVVNWHLDSMDIAYVDTSITVKECRDIAIDKTKRFSTFVIESIEAFIEEVARGKKILGICFIVAGFVSAKDHSIFSNVLSMDANEHVIEALHTHFKQYKLGFFNDTACLAYAENVFKNHKLQDTTYLYININQGVGAAMVNRGEILRKADGFTTQFGHLSLDINGEKCSCGNRGCLENRIGELALPKRISERGMTELFPKKEKIHFKDIAALESTHPTEVDSLLDDLAKDLSYGINNSITFYHPDVILIGGRGKELGESFLEKVRFHVSHVGFFPFSRDIQIAYACFDKEIAISGAVKYYIDHYLSFDHDAKDNLIIG